MLLWGSHTTEMNVLQHRVDLAFVAVSAHAEGGASLRFLYIKVLVWFALALDLAPWHSHWSQTQSDCEINVTS